jgi:hypothetical protein
VVLSATVIVPWLEPNSIPLVLASSKVAVVLIVPPFSIIWLAVASAGTAPKFLSLLTLIIPPLIVVFPV